MPHQRSPPYWVNTEYVYLVTCSTAEPQTLNHTLIHIADELCGTNSASFGLLHHIAGNGIELAGYGPDYLLINSLSMTFGSPLFF